MATEGVESTAIGALDGAGGPAAPAEPEGEDGLEEVQESAQQPGAPDSYFKLSVWGFHKFHPKSQIQKWLASQGVEHAGMKKVPHTQVAVLKFSTPEERDAAWQKLESLDYKGSKLRMELARQVERPSGMGPTSDSGPEPKRARNDGGGKTERESEQQKPRKTLQEAVTPLWGMPYEEQLAKKQADMQENCVKKLFHDLKAAYNKRNRQAKSNKQDPIFVPSWLKAGPSSLTFEDIRSSPATLGYRNKCEFTVGRDAVGDVTVGFRVSSFTGGSVVVESPQECVHLDERTKVVALAVQNYLRASSAPIYDILAHSGVWRYLTVRSSHRTGQCLVIFCVAIERFGADAWTAERDRLTAYLTAAEEPSLPLSDGSVPASNEAATWTGITSIYIQPFEGKSNPGVGDPVLHAWGQTHLEEVLLGLTFRISPDAFFQVNTAGAEVLFSAVIECCKNVMEEEGAGEDGTGNGAEEAGATILDVCCGTGTIGICCAVQTKASAVLGIEVCQGAVEDAVVNAARNGVENASFVCSKAEDVLLKGLGDRPYSGDDAVTSGLHKVVGSGQPLLAVVDPPRDGLHADCVKAIRNCGRITRLVYVSCNPTRSLIKDAQLLCAARSKQFTTAPFRPVRAIPVDMFPQTDHCELIMVFERMTSLEDERGGPRRKSGLSSASDAAVAVEQEAERDGHRSIEDVATDSGAQQEA